MRIDTAPIFEAFDGVLGVLEPEERARIERILAAGEDSVQRALVQVLREAADEVNAVATEVQADLRHGPDGAEFVVSASPQDGPRIELQFESDEIERLTLRLPAELKELASLAARQHGVSLNTWLMRLVGREAGSHASHASHASMKGTRGWSWPSPGRGADGGGQRGSSKGSPRREQR